eukprot:Sspe_Gene.99181::Locus_72597_Transcript_1_1_Confidence_1.000_Length_1581::g.99181::m.99181
MPREGNFSVVVPGRLSKDMLPEAVQPDLDFLKKDPDIRCCVICYRYTSKNGKLARVCIIGNTNLCILSTNGVTRRSIPVRSFERIDISKDKKALLLTVRNGEDLLLLEKIDSRNRTASPPQSLADIPEVLNAVREANSYFRIQPEELPTVLDVKRRATNLQKKHHTSLAQMLESDKKEVLQLREEEKKDKERGGPPPTAPTPTAAGSPREVTQRRPPPPPGPPPRLLGSAVSEPGSPVLPTTPLTWNADQMAQAEQLSRNIEQLHAERDLLEAQIQARKHDFDLLTQQAKCWQEQLDAQQEQMRQQQVQFANYMTEAQKQYQEYMKALFEQHQQQEEQRRQYELMHHKMNEEAWERVVAQTSGLVLDDEDSDTSADSGEQEEEPAHWRRSLSKKHGVASEERVVVKVKDESLLYSLSVPRSFWTGLKEEVRTVAGAREHPFCLVTVVGDPAEMLVNKQYFQFYASGWSKKEEYTVSLWDGGSWSFVDARCFWNGSKRGPGPLEKAASYHST